MREKSSPPKGFTVIEVIIAVLILSSALMVLLGLQGATLQRAFTQQRQQQAMLIARSILASIESNPDTFPEQDIIKSAYEMLRDLKILEAGDTEERDRLADFETRLTIQSVILPFPPTLENPINMKRVILDVYWGDKERMDESERLQVFFLVAEDVR